MFTLEQIKQAHDKVKRVLIFQIISRLNQFGCKGYDTLLNDGSVAYYGSDDYSVSTDKNMT
jgi:hypothetical protein